MKQYLIAIAKIKKHLARNPEEKSLIFYCLAGHGMVEAGEQKLLVNEYDTKTFFYKMINPEADIRSIATNFKNSYQIALFACCREVLSRDIHTGGLTEKDVAERREAYRRQA